jgi:DNA-binding NtrC family response regulator
MEKILVVDDEKDVHYSFQRILESDGYKILSATSGKIALRKIQQELPDLILLDVRLTDVNGLDLLKTIRSQFPESLVLVMTAFGTSQAIIEAMQRGAYDFVVKPFDVPHMKQLIREALESKRRSHADGLSSSLDAPKDGIDEPIVGKSDAMRQIFKMIGNVAPRDVNVLITGESGTGKELVARSFHAYSLRAAKTFLPLNCSAIPETLLEGELFGYERGAFTGAVVQRHGKVELCNGGTLFLDEIGDMPLLIQSKILRFLQDGEFKRLGGNHILHSDVRVLAATNKDLLSCIQMGTFREDLYYRLNVVEIRIAPLRERREDITLLTDHFLQKFNRELGLSLSGVSPPALKKLVEYSWPGNVRELENCIKRAMVLTRRNVLLPEDFSGLLTPHLPLRGKRSVEEVLGYAMDRIVEAISSELGTHGFTGLLPQVEKRLVEKALAANGGNQVRTARLLGISRTTLRSKLKRYGML